MEDSSRNLFRILIIMTNITLDTLYIFGYYINKLYK